MVTRRSFVQGSVVGAGMAVAAEVVTAQSTPSKRRFSDKLTDDAGKYAVAPLPYAYDALEPVIDAKTVEFHYNFHHKPAAVAANRAEESLSKARDTGDYSQVKALEKELAFQLSSHVLHTIYWSNLSSKGGGEPKGDLLRAIGTEFGSFERFKAHLTAAAVAIEASGWGLLGYQPSTKKLMILQCENHQKLTVWGVVPLLMLDVFEHAYYLKYQNRRPEYVNNLFNIINWDNVAERYDAAHA